MPLLFSLKFQIDIIILTTIKLNIKSVTSDPFKCSSLITKTSDPYNLYVFDKLLFDKLLVYQHDFLRQQNVQREVYPRCFCALFCHRLGNIYYSNIFSFSALLFFS